MFESGEMYLETILIVSRRKSPVRSIDIVEEMNFSKPSVSRAMSKLRADGYVNMDASGFLTLTDKGLEIAEKIYERHQVLSKLLMGIGVPEEVAVADACKIEHDISDVSFSAIKEHIKAHTD